MNWLEYAVLFVVAGVVTIALVPVAKRLAVCFDAIDYPSARRVNMLPIPRLGGVAIYGGIVAAIIALFIGIAFFGWENPFIASEEAAVNYIGVFVGITLMFTVGVIDDVADLSPKIKMLGQIVAACIVAGSGLLLANIHNPIGEGYIEFGWVAYPLTVFYLVAFANVINLIDGLDGLAAGITAISATTILIFAVLTDRPDAAVFSVLLLGACIGFSLGIISLFAVARSTLFVSLLVPILAAGVPILDTFFAIVRRKREHRPIDEADKGHIHHRLMRAGFSQRATVLIMWGWTIMLSACAMVVTVADNLVRIPIFIVAAGVTIYAIVKLRLLGDALSHHFNPRKKPDQGAQVDNADLADGKFAGGNSLGTESANTHSSDVK